MKNTFILTIALMSFCAIIGCGLRASDDDASKIIGTWLVEEEGKYKLVFTADNKCKQYYGSELLETDTYVISNTSPQCGLQVTVDSHTSFLQLTNIDGGEKTCYEINGITDENLSLRVLGEGGFILFNRK